MVTQYGMSESLGLIQYGRGNHQVFLGRDFGEDRNYSEEIAGKIDTEVRKIIDGCYADARKILEVNWDKVERMANSLLEHETVEAPEVLAILGDKPWPPNEPVVAPVDQPVAASAPPEPETRPERPKRLPNISPEPA
jgi:cell division protease FtsH